MGTVVTLLAWLCGAQPCTAPVYSPRAQPAIARPTPTDTPGSSDPPHEAQATPASADPSVPLADLRTRAEATDYRETSSYEDVIAFLDALQRAGAPCDLQWIGHSVEGRPIPLVVAGPPEARAPAAARRAERVVVYVQANIHAGEVEGKEASLALLRELALGEHPAWLANLVLLVNPIYNSDGNDAWGDGSRMRPSQNGPARVGRRTNGQHLDLNRDCIKAESPEMSAVLASVYGAWDPDAVLDLHTTNGTRHGYPLTYSPPLDPNTDPGVLAYCRDELLPQVRDFLRREHGLETFDYGNFARGEPGPRWVTFGPESRYVTNYAGTRNRIGVLSEAASYQPFEVRVKSTERFVAAVLDRLATDRKRVLALVRDADARSVARAGQGELGVRFEMAQRGEESVLLERRGAHERGDPPTAPTDLDPITVPIFDRFHATLSRSLPADYLLPAALVEVAALLDRHGIAVERLREEWQGDVEQFTVGEQVVAERAFQGHRLVRLEGEFAQSGWRAPAGTFVVSGAQPRSTLLFTLLEPESRDGVAAWNLLDRHLRRGGVYPVRKCSKRVMAARERWHPNRP